MGQANGISAVYEMHLLATQDGINTQFQTIGARKQHCTASFMDAQQQCSSSNNPDGPEDWSRRWEEEQTAHL